MQLIPVRELRSQSAAVWKKLERVKDLVITSNGKPIAILSATSENKLEETLALMRKSRAMHAVATMQDASQKAGLNKLSLQDINTEIDASRKKRK